MKKLLVVSSLMNVVLAGSLCLVWRPAAPDGAGTTGEGGAGQARKAPEERSATGARAEAAVPAVSAGAPFQWRQIESTDYRVYIANLRRIGCPETTVRDIIRADVRGLFGVKRKELGQQAGQAGQWSPQAEEALIADLLGQEPPVLAEAKPRAKVARQIQAAEPSLPVAFLTVAPEVLKLTPEQQEAVQLVRDTFLARVGGVGQYPDDPAYHERWQKAQPEADELLKAYIGRSAFQEYQIGAAMQAGGPGGAGR